MNYMARTKRFVSTLVLEVSVFHPGAIHDSCFPGCTGCCWVLRFWDSVAGQKTRWWKLCCTARRISNLWLHLKWNRVHLISLSIIGSHAVHLRVMWLSCRMAILQWYHFTVKSRAFDIFSTQLMKTLRSLIWLCELQASRGPSPHQSHRDSVRALSIAYKKRLLKAGRGWFLMQHANTFASSQISRVFPHVTHSSRVLIYFPR